MSQSQRYRLCTIVAIGGYLAMLTCSVAIAAEKATRSAAAVYHSPSAVIASPDGRSLYVADQTSRSIVVFDTAKGDKVKELPVAGEPRALALSSDGGKLYVAEHRAAELGRGTVAVIDTASGKVAGRIEVGRWPVALAISANPQRLYVANQGRNSVSVIELEGATPVELREIPVSREPSSLAIGEQGHKVIVANLLPNGSGLDPSLAAKIDIIDTGKLKVSSTIKLPPGSTLVRGVCTDPAGKWAYVVHGLGRFTSPITQLERGWVNTYALSIIDIAAAQRVATVLLDELTQGAADPHSIVCSSDGRFLWISHAGVHEVSRIDAALLHQLLLGKVPPALAQLKDGMRDNIWVQIQREPKKISVLQDDLTALFIAGVIERFPSGGIGPRSLALAPDQKTLYVGNYFSGEITAIDTEQGRIRRELSMGDQAADSVRRGEIIFHDATRAFQRWHSCASCHANEGRVDGLRWDFLADGIGNAKDTMNLVFFHKTEPLNRRATVAKAIDCTRGGLESTNGLVPTEQEVEDLYAYLTSLKPMPSPRLTAEGRLSESALRGKAIFNGRAGCAHCHPAPYFTDQKMHNVGVLSPNEPDGRYDTPSLIEAYRTAPYLHDGRAVTIEEVLRQHNDKNLHGKVKGLSDQEMKDLIEYIMSL